MEGVTHKYGEEDIEIDLSKYSRVYRVDGPLDSEECKSYIGKCSLVDASGRPRDIDERFADHIRSVNREHNSPPIIKAAFERYGSEAFKITAIELCLNEDVSKREIYWINTLNTQHPNGYNSMGGNPETGRYELHPDTKRLISQNRSGFHRREWPEGSFPRAKVQLVRTVKAEGYRGFHKGLPKAFMSGGLTMEAKKALALAWHLFGEDPGRLPHVRTNALDAQGNAITQKGVYPCLDKDGNIRNYRGQHPNRSELVQRTFKTVGEASAFAKLLMSLPVDNTPAEYLQKTKREARPADMKYLKKKSDKNGDLYGYEVELGPKVSKSGTRISRLFGVRTKTIEENTADAKAFRDENLKEPLRI